MSERGRIAGLAAGVVWANHHEGLVVVRDLGVQRAVVLSAMR
jgi:hypothetical protein